ncbi:MAG: acetate uptake transporter [Syntrophobacteraceae bacterium]
MAEQTNNNAANQPIADPSTVGLAAFAIALFTLSFLNAGVIGPKGVSTMIPLALISGVIQIIVAFYGFRKNELFTALVFGLYGMFWIVYSLINLGVALKWYELDATALLFFIIAYAIFSLYVLVASFATNAAVIITVFLLFAVFVLVSIGLAGFPSFIAVAGYVGIADALMAFYVSAAGLLGTLYGRSVLPV